MTIHPATYGDSIYKDIKASFVQSAVASSFFDVIHEFSETDIDEVFFTNIYSPLRKKRGGGCWIWKPYFVKKVLDEIPVGDILFYCDAGSTINSAGAKRFGEYIEMVPAAPTGTIDFALFWREYQYTKAEVFVYFDATEHIIFSSQLVGGILILRKCKHSQMLVDKWYDTAVNHPFLFTDEKFMKQHPEFIDHRHDQSIFSVIRKTYGGNFIGDETYFSDFEKHGKAFPIWATQRKA
jgi:hypothetical protein